MLKRNINQGEVYRPKFWLPATLLKAHVSPQMHSMKSSDKPMKETKLPRSNQKILAKKHNDEKIAVTLLIVGKWIDFLSFLVGFDDKTIDISNIQIC